MNDMVVIGLGSPLMSDEGVGVHLIKKMSTLGLHGSGVDFIDLGTAGARILHAVAGRRKAIFIDCALMGEKPGTIRRFTPDDVRSEKRLPRMSLHEGDLMQFIELSRKLGECPDEVVIFGIQPQDISPGLELSPVLAAQMDEYARVIAAEFKDRQVKGSDPLT